MWGGLTKKLIGCRAQIDPNFRVRYWDALLAAFQGLRGRDWRQDLELLHLTQVVLVYPLSVSLPEVGCLLSY